MPLLAQDILVVTHGMIKLEFVMGVPGHTLSVVLVIMDYVVAGTVNKLDALLATLVMVMKPVLDASLEIVMLVFLIAGHSK